MNPVTEAMDRLIDMTVERHGWLLGAGEKVDRWREEDRANGIEWESQGSGGVANNLPPEE